MNRQSPSIARRALLAVVLLIGFYVLALCIAWFLVWWPFQFSHVPGKLAVMSVIGAALILWSILPRFDRFPAPGVRITRETQPRLFDEIEGMSKATGQDMPVEVYLVDDVNAFVAQRGGMMGFGSRRVMGIGLPLLNVLTVGQFRAVIAHEFGHFYGGDTKLGPWIYKTRAAIGRTIATLSRTDASFVQAPFRWYGTMFLHVTQSISRAQEIAADRLAATIAGGRSLTDGLRNIGHVAPAYEQFLLTEFFPVVVRGHRPELLSGFTRFVQAPKVSEALEDLDRKRDERTQADVFDSHPSLVERIAAVADLPAVTEHADGSPAIALLADTANMELQLLRHRLQRSKLDVTKMPPIDWDDVCGQSLIPAWIEDCRKQSLFLSGHTVAGMPRLVGSIAREVDKLVFQGPSPDLTGRKEAGAGIANIAFALALHRAGWQISSEPGHPIVARRGEQAIEPLGTMERILMDKEFAAQWPEFCAKHGIGDLALAVPEGD